MSSYLEFLRETIEPYAGKFLIARTWFDSLSGKARIPLSVVTKEQLADEAFMGDLRADMDIQAEDDSQW